MDKLSSNNNLLGWNGLGLAVQAYQKRAFYVIDWLEKIAKRDNRIINVRLVKGAYWDSEIKLTQELGVPNYPVFTRKSLTDLSWMACSKKLFFLIPNAEKAVQMIKWSLRWAFARPSMQTESTIGGRAAEFLTFTNFDADQCVRLQIDPSTTWRWSQGPKIDKMRNPKKCFFSHPERRKCRKNDKIEPPVGICKAVDADRIQNRRSCCRVFFEVCVFML